MKKTIKIIVGTLFIVLAGYGAGIAQESQIRDTYRAVNTDLQEFTEMESSKTLQFNNESNKAEVTIPMDKEYNVLLIEIHGTFQQGEILVELFDPKGNKKGFFTIKTETNISKGKNTSVMEKVSGKLAKHYRDPLAGDWLIRMSPKTAVGYININTTMVYNPHANAPAHYVPGKRIPKKDRNNNDTK